jgi:hypothetical protein
MPFRIRPVHTGTLAASLMILLAACGDDSNSPSNDDSAIDQTEAQSIADEVSAELAGISSSFSLGDLANPGGDAAVRAGYRGPGALVRIPGCPTFSDDTPADTDEDGVPDDLTLSYDPEVCILANRAGTAEFTLRGEIRVQDLSATDVAGRLSFDDFRAQFVYGDRTFSREVDGALRAQFSGQEVAASDSTTVVQKVTGRPDATLAKALTIHFAATNEDFALDQPLPDGDFSVDGILRRTSGDRRRTLEVITTSLLEYDASCLNDNRIVDGSLVIHFDSETHEATVMVSYNGCGVAPTVTLVSGPAT